MESDGITLTQGHKGLEGGFRRRQRYKNLSCVLSLRDRVWRKAFKSLVQRPRGLLKLPGSAILLLNEFFICSSYSQSGSKPLAPLWLSTKCASWIPFSSGSGCVDCIITVACTQSHRHVQLNSRHFPDIKQYTSRTDRCPFGLSS